MVNQNRSALEIYTRGYGYNREVNSWEFFSALQQAITTELEQYGFCALLDKILEENWRTMNVVAYSAIREIFNQYNMQPPSSLNYFVPNVKDEGRPVAWEDCKNFDADCSPIDEPARNRIRDVRAMGREIHRNQIDNPGSWLSGLVQSGAKKAQDTFNNGQAQRDADKIKNEAERKAQEITDKAQSDARATMDKAQSEAREITAKAQRDADATRAQAEADAKELTEAARQAAEKTTAAAQKEARNSADVLVKRYLQEAQRQTAQQCSKDAAQFAQEYLEKARSADEIHDQMCNELGSYQVAWVSSFDEMSRQLAASKSEFYAHLDKWRASLAPRDWTPLAERYVELYKIINNNLHEQIAAEVALRDAQRWAETVSPAENADGQGQAEPVDAVSHDTDGAAAPAAPLADGTTPREGTLEVLQELDRIFTRALGRFRNTLKGLGLAVYFPEPGEVFDDVRHTCEDMSDDPTGKIIVRCILPGVAKEYYNDESTVLVAAVVEVES